MFKRILDKQDRLVFVHIGKNGGITLQSILDGQFQSEKICKKYNVAEIINANPKELEQYNFYRGHFTREVRDYLPSTAVFITMLRNPLERSRSVYQHIYNGRHEHQKHSIVSRMSFREYVFAEDLTVYTDINNWQARVITNTLDPHQQPDLVLAKKYLEEEYAWVGLTERYNDSLELLSYTFGWPSLTQYEKQNVTPNRIEHIEPDVLARIQELNQIDIALYAFAVELFEKRWRIMRADKAGISPEIFAIFDTLRARIDSLFAKRLAD